MDAFSQTLAGIVLAEQCKPLLARTIGCCAPLKNIAVSPADTDALVANAVFGLWSILESGKMRPHYGRPGLAALEEWAARTSQIPTEDDEAFKWHVGQRPLPVMALIDDVIALLLDQFVAPHLYAAVLRGAGRRIDITSDEILLCARQNRCGRHRNLVLRSHMMLEACYRACDASYPQHIALPYLRWPDIAECEAAGSRYRGSPALLLPGAVAAALAPLVRPA